MGVPLIEEFLTGDSKEIRDLANNEAALVGFLTLAKGIDDLPGLSLRFYEESRSLYQVTATGHSIHELVDILSAFFGSPAKAPGKNLPVALRFDPTLKHLGGIRKDQAFFLKKLKTGAFYGALWPWQRDTDKIEVHLGFHSASISNADYHQLGTLVQKFLSKKKIETISGVGGQIHGISLPSFLQMSEMEGATYALKVTTGNRTGHLYLDGGSLIAAHYQEHTGNQAAYRIISWDNASIQIEAADPGRDREIHDPLMHVMMESLKIKDEAGAQPVPSAPASQSSTSPPEAKKTQSPADGSPASEADQAVTKSGQQASAPVAEQVVDKETAQLQPMLTLVSVPFKKATDRSLGKQNQRSRTANLLILLGLVIIFAFIVAGGGTLLKKSQVTRRYDQLVEDLNATKALDAQIVLLMQYLKAHPGDAHRSELEARLNETNIEIERRDYEKTILDVNRLPIDEKYEKKALSIYTTFITKYPQSPYTDKINEAIGGIRQLLGTAFFEDLKKVSTTDYLDRYEAYRAYLEQFPQGSERTAVEGMISDLAHEYTGFIEKQAAACDARENWDDCIAQCDRFLSALSNTASVETVRQLRAVLQDKKDLVELAAQAALAVDDDAAAKKIYTDYLEKRPDTTEKEAIVKRIDALDAGLARKAAWNKIAAYADNPAIDIFSRVRQLDSYAEREASGVYATLAQKLRARLDPQLQDAIRLQREQTARRQKLARQQAEQARRTKEALRIQKLQNRVARQLDAVANRFTAHRDGTVTDRFTGLTWCLLDSYLDLGRCIAHETAKAYVHGLSTGGYADWRLPTAGELGTLYKNSPFFPDTGAAWYWTSESFARGYHRVVDVVTSEPETVFTRHSKTEDSCGAVRAVRR